MERCVYAVLTPVITVLALALVVVPRFFLLCPVPVGIGAHNAYRLPPKYLDKAKADTSKHYHNKEFLGTDAHIPLWITRIGYLLFTPPPVVRPQIPTPAKTSDSPAHAHTGACYPA